MGSTKLFLVLSFLAVLAGLVFLFSDAATSASVLMTLACTLAIWARIAQAGLHHGRDLQNRE